MAVATLRALLESERSSLQEIDASIRRIVQAPVPRHNHHDRFNSSGDASRGLGTGLGRVSGGGRGEYPDESNKRRHETKTVFSRLSARQGGDSDHEEEAGPGKKPRLSSQVTRDMPSKQEIMKAQCNDEQSKVRNRRIFGSLLGTLQKFKQEEIVLKSKEDKRAEVEKRIEQQALQEKEKQKHERQTLFAERELKKATIKALEAKVARVAEFDVWAAGQKALGNFILTRATPQLYWLPRIVDTRAQEKLAASQRQHEELMEKKQQKLEEELVKIEQKCLRNARTPQIAVQSAKENKTDEIKEENHRDIEKASPSKREKFVSEVRVKHENGSFLKQEEERERRNTKRERTVSSEHSEAVKDSTVPEESTRKLEEIENSSVKDGGSDMKSIECELPVEVEHNAVPAASSPDCSKEEEEDTHFTAEEDKDHPRGGSGSGDDGERAADEPESPALGNSPREDNSANVGN